MKINTWTQFLNNLRDLCHHKLTFPKRQKYTDIRSLVDDVTDELLKPNLVQDVRSAIEDMQTDPDDKVVLDFLEREIEFFNNLIASSRTPTNELNMSEEETDDAIEAGGTIKESFEKIIKRLPKIVQGILKILNEILSILKGG